MQDHYLDFEIWNHKRFLEHPVLASNDGDVAAFRRWFRQFYASSGTSEGATR